MRFFRSLCIAASLFALSPFAHSQDISSGGETKKNPYSIEELLSGYFKNNISLLKLSAELDSQTLSLESEKIANGFSIKLSSGTVQISSGKETEINFKPTVSMELPQADNLSLSVSSDFQIVDGSSERNTTSISLGADIYSGSMENRKIKLEQAQRNLTEAQRNLKNGFIKAETEFYTSVRNLYEIMSKMISAEKDLYEDTLTFEQLRAQGYPTGSSKYRLAQMEVSNDEFKVDEYKHELERETRIFASKCGISYNGKNAVEFLPDSIPSVEPLNIRDFRREDFAQTESAVWTSRMNERKRKADKDVTVKASAGYTLDNEISRDEYKDTIDASTSITLMDSGLTATAGVSVPSDFSDPVYKFGITVTPNNFRQAKISRQQENIQRNRELLNIDQARIDYVTTVVAQVSSLKDLLWAKQKDEETFELYTQLEKDSAMHLKKGIITESEYKSAKVNMEKYRIQCLIDKIKLVLYNNTTQLYFIDDTES